LKTLLLTLGYPSRASYYDDWRDAFIAAPQFDVTVRNIFDRAVRAEIERSIGDYELTVLLHACTADSLLYAEPLAGALQNRKGRLVAFVGNELNLPFAPLGAKVAWLKRVRPDIVATQLLQEAGAWLYAEVGARVISLPHALNPQAFEARTPQRDRPIDIGARSFRYLAYLGDDERNRIYDYFAANRFSPRLALDFSTEQRFDRAGWAAFLDRCKATIATEAGSWFLERDDATVLAIRDHLAHHDGSGFVIRADSPLQGLAHRLPYQLKALARRLLRRGPIRHEALTAERADFAEIHARFFANRPRAPVYAKCISSRHFDAVGTKTVQIMFPGRYNDILEADRHYLALQPDFANVDAVMARFRDPAERSGIVDAAHAHVMAGHTYAHRMAQLGEALNKI
jgi:Glycosyl transferases group 1